jgi:nucleoside-diphosphate-sugar epimerase
VDEASGLTITVSGAGGLVGSALLPALAEAGRRPSALALRGVTDVRLPVDTEVVVHLAALAHRRGASTEELRRVNVELTEKVGRAAASGGARMIFVSTVKVHGEESDAPFTERSAFDPRDPYAWSKVRAEEALRHIAGLRLTVLRPPLVYGPGVKANFLALMRAVARGVPLPLASVANRRSLLYVGNLADAIIRCIGNAASEARTYLVSDGEALSSAALCREIGDALGRPARLVPFPPAILGMVPGLRALTRSLEVDDRAIRRDLGWQPVFSRRQGLAATAAWFHAVKIPG